MAKSTSLVKSLSLVFWALSIVPVQAGIAYYGHLEERQASTTSKLVCNADNVLRALRNPSVSNAASTFCSTFTTATSSVPLPTYVSQYPASRVSSACTCLMTAVPSTTTTTTPVTSSTTTPITSSTTSSTISTIASTTTSSNLPCGTPEAYPYYLSGLKHQGKWIGNSTHQIFRNVKCWGAKGDGETDDTDAIIRAASEGKACPKGDCQGFYVPPIILYFPSGTYKIRKAIPLYRNTLLSGNPLQPPVITYHSSFAGGPMIETKPEGTSGSGIGDFTLIRSIVISVWDLPASIKGVIGIKWNVGYASGIENVQLSMGQNAGNDHRGLVIENSEHVFVTDTSITGGKVGAEISARSGTFRGVSFQHMTDTAIKMIYNYEFTFKSLFVNNITYFGIDASRTRLVNGVNSQASNSIVVLESEFTNLLVAVRTARGGSSVAPIGAGAIVLERIVVGPGVTPVRRDNGIKVYNPRPWDGVRTINWWAQGRKYTPPQYAGANFTGEFVPASTVNDLQADGKYLERPRPVYSEYTAERFISVMTLGAKGDGVTDDTAKLQEAFDLAANTGRSIFIDHGTYIVTKTLRIRPGAQIVGEVWPRIMASGPFFADEWNPKAVLELGPPGYIGYMELQDVLVTAKAGSAGAISYQWNLNGRSAGMWDSHSVIGGQIGSGLELAQCRHDFATNSPRRQCMGAFMHLHITAPASDITIENAWFSAVPYQFVPKSSNALSVYVGRGVYIEDSWGPIWLYSVTADNSVFYQFQFVNAVNIFASSLEGSNPSFQSNPAAPVPFSVNPAWEDPSFKAICPPRTGAELLKCARSYGLRIVNSDNVLIYSTALLAGLDNYGRCPAGIFNCQLVMISVEKQARSPVNKYVNIYGMTVKGARYALILDGKIIVDSQQNAGTSLALPVVTWWYVGGSLP
ncbi:hypothetical protein ABW19_dt0209110 [Dactylella cylindrospora]|nr:hypothetical protein ABW19_dt0209110 [Dactylella cylindrospora]